MAQTDRTTGLVGNAAFKVPCRAATTANVVLSGEQTIDGVACVTGDRLLAKNQTDTTTNGIWVVDTGTWARSQDFDGAYDVVKGSVVIVTDGVTGVDYYRVTTENSADTGYVDVGTAAITFEQALSNDAASVNFLQAGAGAVAETLQNRGRRFVYATDFLSEADRVLLRAGTVVDMAAAVALAFAVAAVVVLPDSPYYKFGSQVSVPDAKGLLGFGKHSTKIAKAFNGDMIVLGNQSFIRGIYLDGAGATFTGRGIIINAGNGKQYVGFCKVIDFASYALDFAAENAGSQFLSDDCEFTQVVGTAVGQEAVRIQGALTALANPRTFIGVQTQGKRFINLGPCNNLFITASRPGDILWSDDSRGVCISTSRLAGTTTPMVVKGANHSIGVCNIAPQIELGAGLVDTTIRGNNYNVLPIINTANSSTNEFELSGLVDKFAYRVEAGGGFMPFADGDATPSVATRTCFQVANTGSTLITNFDDGFNGQVIIVRLNALTGITHNNANIRLANSISIPVGFYGSNDMICFERISGIWFEKWRSPSQILRSAVYDPPNLADGAGATTTVTCVGAALGDFADASFSLDLQGITVTAYVSSSDTVSVRFQNESGGALDLGSGTLRVKVTKAV